MHALGYEPEIRPFNSTRNGPYSLVIKPFKCQLVSMSLTFHSHDMI